MPKRSGWTGRTKPKGMRKVAPADSPRERRAAAELRDAAEGDARSQIRRLAAEVERLERELEATRAQMARLAARADIDPLTDVLNRRGFERELHRSLAYMRRHGASAALIYVDLDDFKRVNDDHGHIAGDAMLKEVARVLKQHVRASDIVARLGGDEFVLMLWNCSEADACGKADLLQRAIERTTASHGGLALTVGASCGAAPLLATDRPAEALERADRAMYARKASRRQPDPR